MMANTCRQKSYVSILGAALLVASGFCSVTARADDEARTLTPEILAVYAVSADEKIDDKGCSVKITVDHEKFADVLPILVRRGMIGDGMSAHDASDKILLMEFAWTLNVSSMLLKQDYDKNPKIDRCSFESHASVPDDFGNVVDHILSSYDFDRALFKKINWDKMETRNLIKVAPHFKMSDWLMVQASKETD